MKYILTIIVGIALLGIVTSIYAGECEEVDLSGLEHHEDISYLVVGNSSDTEGMNINFNPETQNVSICFAVNYAQDTFTIIFFNEEDEVIVEHHYHSSGGSSRTVYVENKTIEQVDVPTYIDREIYVTNSTLINDIVLKNDKNSIVDELSETSWSWWYLYGFLFVCILGGIFYWLKSVYHSEELEEEDVVTKE